ncbi:nuclease-related domain-containing protein [Candidatus Thiodictyon syntrophicum]|jgi:hypothetical protein|uniref:NERD domain-containing protein n=1 Tax=Candidatus Thiodictyon syntrophicum TaxID=1166950 RepID=A0A2K8U6L6_9GAMM|nr:nuclease-related domain-containing protein [Candidatus Thiodictyon syntrophicum]AUB81213.1 hypothetical protein THSYN_09790 [Candidatus Thiodictyon syntrophicum]
MVRHILCGTFVNESERLACARLFAKLQAAPGDWIILSNLNHAQHPSVRSDEIDAVVIGPPGVFVLDSFQEAEGYPGELVFYSLVDPAAPTLSERRKDSGCDLPARLAYAQAASLLTLFEPGEQLADQVRGILELGCAPNPSDRPPLDDLAQALADLAPAEAPAAPPSLPPADYWDEDTVVDFQQSRYKIVGRLLGKGGIGLTFKVVELDAHSDEKFGTYVAKLVRDAADGEAAILAYKPKNLIVQGGTLVLTDYDTVALAGEAARGGTFPYTSRLGPRAPRVGHLEMRRC